MQLKRIVRKKKAELPYTGIDGKPLKDLKFSASRAENLAMLREIFKDIDVLKAVSYTHLDVYKRQGERGAAPGSLLHLSPAGRPL